VVSRRTDTTAGRPVHHRRHPRWGRIGLLTGSLLLTVGTAATAAGIIPLVPDQRAALAAGADDVDRVDVGRVAAASVETGQRAGSKPVAGGEVRKDSEVDPPPAPPKHSGQGRRVVFDMSAQRVWLVRDDGRTAATYLVSGSIYDNLDPGRYEVFSRSRHATSFDYASTMDFMVRFTYGNQAAIGFHDIPVDGRGRPLQRVSELGTATSHGCIRQRTEDARRMWEFAPVGTSVVVTA